MTTSLLAYIPSPAQGVWHLGPVPIRAYALAIIGSEGRDALCELVVRSDDGFAREMAREALDRAVQRRSA